jgi:hypothetical protein
MSTNKFLPQGAGRDGILSLTSGDWEIDGVAVTASAESLNNLTPTGNYLQVDNNLGDVESIPSSRTNLGLGDAPFSIVADETFIAPLPSRIICDTTTGVINVKFEDFSVNQVQLGQLIEIKNSGNTGFNVNILDHAGAVLAEVVPPGFSNFLRVTGIAPDTVSSLILSADFEGPVLSLDTVSTGTDYTLAYPLPSIILINTNTSSLNLKFPAFDLTKCKRGQKIFVANTGSNVVIPKNSAGSQFGSQIDSGGVALIGINTASPDTIVMPILLGKMAFQALPAWFDQTASTVVANLGLTIGTNVQAFNSKLQGLSALDNLSGLVQQTAANTFSKVDFSNGNWNPTVGDGTNNFTLSTSSGIFYRIGTSIFYFIRVVWTSVGSATGALRISCPFVGSPSTFTATIGFNSGINFLVGGDFAQLVAQGANPNSYLQLYAIHPAGVTNKTIAATDCSSTGELNITGQVAI